jgi:hypothetical protein
MKIKKTTQALKAEDFDEDDVAVKTAAILSVEQKETEFGDRNYLSFHDETKDEDAGIFLNGKSQDALVDQFGEESSDWEGKLIKILCVRGTGKYKKKMLVVKPIVAEKA